jgi:putative alpha-1,2-mannosidase
MPFVTTPFGMTSWTPQTRQNKISVTSYNYDDTTI